MSNYTTTNGVSRKFKARPGHTASVEVVSFTHNVLTMQTLIIERFNAEHDPMMIELWVRASDALGRFRNAVMRIYEAEPPNTAWEKLDKIGGEQ